MLEKLTDTYTYRLILKQYMASSMNRTRPCNIDQNNHLKHPLAFVPIKPKTHRAQGR